MRGRRGRTDGGASAVEFALIMVPLLALLFGLIQYGLYFWAYQGGSDIARSAARLAAVGTPADCATFTSDVTDQIGGMGDKSTAVVKRTYDKADPTKGVQIGDTVNVSVEFRSIDLHFPFVPFIDNGVVKSTAEARVDYVPTQPQEC
jgi:Flp pilus assembly protein TadG